MDNPARGFTFKWEGPLDLRMNPDKGAPASSLLASISEDQLVGLLIENADEVFAEEIAHALCSRRGALTTTTALAQAVRMALPSAERQAHGDLAVRRTFQALRIAVNHEFSALESLLRVLPVCLSPGGRVVILSFHSGEDRRVKHAFQQGLDNGEYAEISRAVLRPGAEERRDNPRSSSAKLRWAIRTCLAESSRVQ
jgi:16S rRNA (cytosine1402-N4)-methyltransferase